MHALLLAVLAVALVACSAGAPSPSETPAPFLDVRWEAVSIDGRPPVAEHLVTIELEAAGRLGGSTGCNSFGGDFRIDGGRLVTDELVMTAAMCADAVANDLERVFTLILGSRPAIGVVDGELRLRGEAGEIVFRPAAAFQ